MFKNLKEINKMTYNSIRKVILVFSIMVCAGGTKQCTVFWETSPNISIHKDIELRCYTMGSSCTGAHKWIGGPSNDVISLVRGLHNHSKYSIELKEKGGRGYYRLTIKHTLLSDFGVKYACLRGFDKFEGILRQKSHFNLIEKSNTTMRKICLFANTTLVNKRMNLNRYWRLKSNEPNSSYEIIKLGGKYEEEMSDDGYNLCINSPSVNDFGVKYQLNYYSALFEVILPMSIIGERNKNKKDHESSAIKVTSIAAAAGIIVFVLMTTVIAFRIRITKCKKKTKILESCNSNEETKELHPVNPEQLS